MHHVEILATSTCPHCCHAVDVVTDMCLGCDAEVHAVDLTHFPELAVERYGYRESPIVVVDGQVVSVGRAPRTASLRELLDAPSPMS